MIDLLVGWVTDHVFHPVSNFFPPSKAIESEVASVNGDDDGFQQASRGLEERTLTPSERGYRFQFDEFSRLMTCVHKWDSVRFMKANGDSINSLADVRRGRDGGVDAIIVISTPTQHGCNIVTGRLRQILKTQDY